MAFKPKFKSGAKQDPIPSGQYDARCYGIVELGTKEEFNKFKNLSEDVTKLMILFEIPELQITWERDGTSVTTPRAMYPRFKVSMHEKAKLRQFIQAWFGKQFKDDSEAYHFDFSKIIGYCAQVSVELNEAGYSNIVTISPLHKSVVLDKQFNESINFGIEDINGPEWDKLYPWIQNIVQGSDEYTAWEMMKTAEHSSEHSTPARDAMEDDFPF